MARSDPDWASWHDDSFKLDADSPLAISRSLWDELSQSEADSRTLFASTPAADITEPFLSSLSHPGGSQNHCDEQDSPRQKRRRMLFFSGLQPQEGSSIQDYEISERAQENPSWCQEDSLEDNLEQPSDCWMETCFNDSDEHNMEVVPCKKIQVPLCHTASEIPSNLQDNSNRGPETPISGRGRKKHRVQGRQKLTSPVAYPFALLKPCGATGDITLSDLNERIQTPRAKPIVRRLSGELGDSESSQSLGAGLSGKSVVALTKIHTEGNGSITIMRTKG
ncbi:protein XRI1 isoform X1 [Selaginella moellendorffii]|uniref:protein XRI1 isoform X1 n=1 Tax=Selaginella moellendorffii TaxID=88036 RepID=UPI000D1CAB14|nr:protein XRI1 isoform X1 [Selaginella moellendorffii]|eukprot:XP_024544709.1 protein XRI1 isoform X1 [Selaginella moellendorffii]